MTRGFGLLRYFATASVLTVAVVTALVGFLIAEETRRDVIEQAQDGAERIVGRIHAAVSRRFIEPQLAEGGSVDLDDPEQQRRLDAVVRDAIEGFDIERVYFFDLDGRITYSTVAEHVGHTIPAGNEAYQRARAGEAASNMVERSSPLDAGGSTTVPLLETYVPVRDGSGRIAGVIETYQNAEDLVADVRAATLRVAAIVAVAMLLITGALLVVFLRGDRMIRTRTRELIAANRALEELTDTLERRVEDRTNRLISQKRLAWLGTLATGIAHEINNPLASIATASEGLLRRIADADTPTNGDGHGGEDLADFRDYLEIIRDEAFRAKGITADLLDFARKEQGRRGPVHANAVIRSVAALMKLRRRRRDHELVLDLAPDDALPTLRGDPNKLLGVVFNITDNAVDALPPSGGRVRWSTAVEDGPDGERVLLLRCEDNGAGIEAEVAERLFEPFFTTKQPGEGTGLGLSISQAIVESHGGKLEVHSGGPGAGTVVTIRLPVAREPAESEER